MSSVIHKSDLTRIRAAGLILMPDHVEVHRPTLVTDSHGGLTETETRVWTGPGRFSPVQTIASAETVRGETAGAARGYTLTVPIDAVVLASDRVKIAGRTFEVESTDTGRSFALFRRLQLVEVT